MRVLVVHNRYQEQGGEDVVVDAEVRLMREAGWDVQTYERDNAELDTMSRAAVGLQSLWSRRTTRELRELLAAHPCDVVHVHNTVPLVSPSVFLAARRSGAAVVQTLHNFRPVCVGGLMLHDGEACRDFVTNRIPVSCVRHGCWRGSRTQSAVLAGSIVMQHARGTYRNDIDAYVTPTEFDRSIFDEAAFTSVPIHVKPHFLHDPPTPGPGPCNQLLFVGRLAREKGIDVLVDAWRRLPEPIPLSIVGDGPMRRTVQELVADSGGAVTWHGRQSRDEVLAHLAGARAIVIPSRFYETFCLTAVEAAAAARPAIVAGHGSLAEIVEDGTTGWHVPVADAGALARTMQAAWSAPDEARRRGREARHRFDAQWRAATNLEQLRAIYESALERRHRGSAA